VREDIHFPAAFLSPYSHYSLIAGSQALHRYFVERCGWEAAAPTLKDPQRVTDPSTLRRWFRNLDSSRPSFSFLRPAMHAVIEALDANRLLALVGLRLCRQTLFPCPLRNQVGGSEVPPTIPCCPNASLN
jgi:hypothetical protein